MSKQTILIISAGMLMLSACSPQSAVGPSANAAAPGDSYTIAEECKDNPLMVAMPEPATISGMTLSAIECQPFSVKMTWANGDKYTEMSLIDSQGPIGDLPEGLANMARNLPLQATMTAITMTDGVYQAAQTAPAGIQELGGPDYLPAVYSGPNGLKYTFNVMSKSQGGEVGALMGHMSDRYVLNILAPTEGVTGVEKGKALYAPWLAATRLSNLPKAN